MNSNGGVVLNLDEELRIFARCHNKFDGEDSANEVMGVILLARQLDPYIISSVDMGWIVRHTLDLGSGKLYSKCRGTEADLEEVKNPNLSSEYRHALKIKELYHLCRLALKGEQLPLKEAKEKLFGPSDRFYYGRNLTCFNHMLLKRLCPEIELPVLQ